MLLPLWLFIFFCFNVHVACQYPKIQGLGISGGSGPRGGIGDREHPVLCPRAFITDGMVPIQPNTTRQLARGPPPTLSRNNGTFGCNVRQIVVDSTENGARQEMLGFGHAWTDSAVAVFDQLEPRLRDQVMQDLFGQDGNNMGFMRHTIGSSDLSYHQYSYDTNGPSFNLGEPDPGLSHFGLGPHGTRMAEYAAKMGDYKGDVFLFGATWSYPGWMKNNALFVAPTVPSVSSHVLWNNSFNPQYIPQAIEYFTRYVDAWKDLGVTINGISPQNEPLNYQGGTTTMYLDAVDEANLLLQGLGGSMHTRGVKILAYDHNTDQPVYPARVIQGAPGLVDIAAWHCYQDPVADYSVLEDIQYSFPGIIQAMTECSNTGVVAGQTNYWIAQNFLPSIQHGASAASMWVMATNPDFGPHSPYGGCTTCYPSIFVNSSTHYEKTHDYYMIGHFSRFIRRGATNYYVLSGNEGTATDWSAQFWVIAVQNPDQGWAVVMMNNMASDQHIQLSFTSSGFVWEGTVPEESVVTWLLPSDEVLARNGTGFWHSGHTTMSQAPYPYQNSSATSGVGSGTGSGTGGFSTGTGIGSSGMCNFTTTSTSSSSSTTSPLPVPNTTHSINTLNAQ